MSFFICIISISVYYTSLFVGDVTSLLMVSTKTTKIEPPRNIMIPQYMADFEQITYYIVLKTMSTHGIASSQGHIHYICTIVHSHFISWRLIKESSVHFRYLNIKHCWRSYLLRQAKLYFLRTPFHWSEIQYRKMPVVTLLSMDTNTSVMF